jgi:uncharacterized membrane protein
MIGRRTGGVGMKGRHPGAIVAATTVAAIDTAYDVVDDVDRALAFEQAISDARDLIARLERARQDCIRAAEAGGKSLDTIAVQMGISRARLVEIMDGRPIRPHSAFAESSPARISSPARFVNGADVVTT